VRVATLKYGIEDIRFFCTNDLFPALALRRDDNPHNNLTSPDICVRLGLVYGLN
jgi:hypothetical protein